MPEGSAPNPAPHHHEGSVKETLISMTISLAMALIAKSYVIEAYVIPTGSMAPTLLGQHMRFHSTASGFTWPVNPWFYADRERQFPLPIQAEQGRLPMVTDPMSASQPETSSVLDRRDLGFTPRPEAMPIRAGDRILVQKYLYEILPPQRYDVVVFKNPTISTENYIKRLIGLPDEQLWIADGDVFSRPAALARRPGVPLGEGWAIRRKPDRVQKALWRPIFDSAYAPRPGPPGTPAGAFAGPWESPDFTAADGALATSAAGDTALRWNTQRWPINDWNWYNDVLVAGEYDKPRYPVGDLRLRANIRPERPGVAVSPVIRTRGHEFRAVISPGRAALEMRSMESADAPWRTFEGSATLPGGLPPGRYTAVEFWHFDQSLELWIDGRRVARAEYHWGPCERLRHATGQPGEFYDNPAHAADILSRPEAYPRVRPEVEWRFSGPVSLTAVALDRDLHYRPGYPINRATDPRQLVTLGPDQFFVCGDNSANSLDGRLWTDVDPWVRAQIDPTVGVVDRRLMLGKAFFVYFPAPEFALGRIPVPDFGRMRFIR
ncbi:MAG: signal peptidase I [Phycisphaerales bacterium]|nr:signal peptidase I [Phycisphaerales bacterium]